MSRPTPEDYKAIFEDHRVGAQIFDELIQIFGRVPSPSEGIDRVLDQFEFAGRRRVIEFITAKINRANGVGDDEPIEAVFESSRA